MTPRGFAVASTAVATAVTVTLAAAAPALAAGTSATSATITVQGGTLSITAPTGAGNLGSRASGGGRSRVSGLLGQVRVNDARSAPAGSGWVASVTSTAFTSSTGPAIPASAIGYTAGPITRVGTATYKANDPTDLTAVVAAVTATEITGDNIATWTPTITVALPGGVPAGVYHATITHSVA